MRGVERALLSVSDKTGIVEFASALHTMDIELVSTGGTFAALSRSGVPVTEVATVTGVPEMMDGRVKTLHPKIHGGILARRDVDAEALAEHGIDGIDLVVGNLYPFEATIARPDCTLELAVDNIDVGGPAMLRAASKNYREVLPVVDPADYADVAERLRAGGTDLDYRLRMAVKAFRHTAAYDAAIVSYLEKRS